MEVKINKDIRQYTESVFFGMSMRQCIGTGAAVLAAVGTYFKFRHRFTNDILSWFCILAATPFGLLGFIQYHGMTAEQALWAWLRSELLEPRILLNQTNNLYLTDLNGILAQKQAESLGKTSSQLWLEQHLPKKKKQTQTEVKPNDENPG